MAFTKPKFQLGRTVGTPGVVAALNNAGENPSTFITRHVSGDWGDLSADDKQANEDAGHRAPDVVMEWDGVSKRYEEDVRRVPLVEQDQHAAIVEGI